MRRRKILVPAFLAATLLVACKDGQSPPVPGSLTPTAGDQQSATVGAALPIAPAVLLKDTKGRPMRGVAVTFAVASGGGSLAGATVVATGADGVAQAGIWTLGTTPAPNTVTATVQGVAAVVFTATANVGAPASITVAGGDLQSAMVGTAVPVPPAVTLKDNFGNAVPNVTVTFVVTGGGGSVAGAAAVTNAAGTATVGSWTLGTTIGQNTLTATPSTGPVRVFSATATAGPATQMAIHAGDQQTIAVSTAVPINPAVIVRDQYNNPVMNTTVTFSVTSGGGSITGAVQNTLINGVATVGSWELGPTTGTNTLRAEAPGLPPVDFTATATEALILTMTVHGGDAQTAPTRWSVGVAPSVVIRDQFGNGASGKTVAFNVGSGGGTIVGATAVTDADGIASIGWWRLGPLTGANTLTATAAGLDAVTFTATAVTPPPSNGYDISVAYVTPPTARQHQAVIAAVTRWQQVITGDLSNFVNFNFQESVCSPAFINETIDDILVQVDFSEIDGPGNILGQAGPCLIRFPDENALTVFGLMRLDAADLAPMEVNGTIDDVILHEMGHILGIGSLWNQPPHALRIFTSTDSVTFIGAGAIAAFLANGGDTFSGPPVPVENCLTGAGLPITGCGAGTQNSHWREAVLGRELMTGFINAAGVTNPLSAITIQSLADIGYTVNVGAADSYTVGMKPMVGTEAPPLFLNEAKPDWPILTLDPR